ncbi:MAG: NAD(P)/FAD-dependent oxidoreductase [Promethearchaeota archaeon]
MTKYVIIGGGPAGATAALQLRRSDPLGEILIISDEDYQFYKRSKIINLISARCSEDDLFIKGKHIYDENNIKFIYNRVRKVIPMKKQIEMENGNILHYNLLLIASGGSPLIFPWKGVDLDGVSTLYNLDDAKNIAQRICNANDVVIIGGGTIAMKAMQNFSKLNLQISIIEKASHLWPIGFDRKVGRILEKKITEKGIHIYLNEEVVGFKGKNKKLTSVILKSGREIPADLAVVTIGMKPNIDFLKDSGIKIEKGVLVDMYMRTNFSDIFAAGDVAQIYDPLYEIPILHPTWGNAKKQGEVAALNMTGSNIKYKGTIPSQTIKIFGFTAIAIGITHSKKNYDELSWVSFEKELSRKFILKDGKLVGALFLGKEIQKKVLKSILKKAVFNRADINHYKQLLFEENFNIDMLLDHIAIES